MALLKRIRASAILESIISAVMIMWVMIAATMIINALFLSSIKKNDDQFQTRIRELRYFALHQKLNLPFYEDTEQWTIEVSERFELKAFNKVNDETEQLLIRDDQ